MWLDIDDTHAKVSFREVPGGSAAPIDWLAVKDAVWMQSPESGSKALHMERMAGEIVGEVQVSAKAPVYLSGTATFGVYKALNASSPPLVKYHYNTQYVDSKGSWSFVSDARQLDEGVFLEPGFRCTSVSVKVRWLAHEGDGTRVRLFDSLGNTLQEFLHPGGESQVGINVARSDEVIYALASSVSNQASSYKGQSYKQVNHYGTSSLSLQQCKQDGVDVQLKQGAALEAASVARWLVDELNYGFLSTEEVVEGNAKPFGNVISFANGHNKSLDTGRLFFYASNMDRSGQDLVRNSICSFTLTEAQIDGTCSNTDAQDAICAKVIFTGHMKQVTNAADREFAKESLFAQNPPMKNWPADHNWKVMELHPTSIFVLYHYGGADDVPLDEYYKASAQPAPAHYQQIAVMPTVNIPRPETDDHEQMARWMVHTLSWGVLHTISTNLNGSPFGHVVSFSDADASGRIFVYMTKMSPSLRDVDSNPWVSLSLSEAQVVSQFKNGSPCRGEIAEEPTCARLTLSGKLEKVPQSEVTLARNGVLGRHRTMWRWPKNHKFEFYELKVADIFFIDFYGGVKPMSTKQYLQAKIQNGIVEAWNDLYLPEELFNNSGVKCSSTIFPWLLSGFLATAVAISVFLFYQRRRRTEYMQVEIKDSEKDAVQ